MYIKNILILALTIFMTSCYGNSDTDVQKTETNQTTEISKKVEKKFVVGKGGDVGGGFGNPVNSNSGIDEESGRK